MACSIFPKQTLNNRKFDEAQLYDNPNNLKPQSYEPWGGGGDSSYFRTNWDYVHYKGYNEPFSRTVIMRQGNSKCSSADWL